VYFERCIIPRTTVFKHALVNDVTLWYYTSNMAAFTTVNSMTSLSSYVFVVIIKIVQNTNVHTKSNT